MNVKDAIARQTPPGARFVQNLNDTAPFNPFQISPLSPVPGVPIGIQYAFGPSRPWGIDNWLLKRRNVTNANLVMVLGDIGFGKTSAAKLICMAYFGLSVKGNRRFRIALDDTRRNDGIPEYGALTNLLGEEQVFLADYKINPLDYKLGLTQADQLSILRDMCEHDSPEVKPIQMHALKAALKTLMDTNRDNASLNAFAEILQTQDVDSAPLKTKRAFSDEDGRKRFRKASQEMWVRLDNILDGEYGEVFGDDHDLAEVLSRRVISLDYSEVPEEALPLVQAIMWRIRTSALIRNDDRFKIDLEIHDENHGSWEYLSYTNAMYAHMKKIRRTGSVLFLLTHRLSDYYSVGAEGSPQRDKATNMVKDISSFILFHQDIDSIPELRQRLGANVITDKVADMLVKLGIGDACVILGTQAPVFVKFHLTKEDMEITESNSANDSQLANSGL